MSLQSNKSIKLQSDALNSNDSEESSIDLDKISKKRRKIRKKIKKYQVKITDLEYQLIELERKTNDINQKDIINQINLNNKKICYTLNTTWQTNIKCSWIYQGLRKM